MTSNLPIGVFDSGVGGLTVVHAIQRLLPHEDILYLGDTARVPYGNRGADTIRTYALNAANFLTQRGVKAIVIACNTASAYGLSAIRESIDIPIIGVIEPVARLAVHSSLQLLHSSRKLSIAVLATRATVDSGVYVRTLNSFSDSINIFSLACPLLVPLAEEGRKDDLVVDIVTGEYFDKLSNMVGESHSLDAIILGCTHYPLLRNMIEQHARDVFHNPQIFDSATSTANDLQNLLHNNDLLNPNPNHKGSLVLMATDSPSSFCETARRIFGHTFSHVEHVDL